MFVRRDRTYFPQAPISFNVDKENRRWEVPSIWLGSDQDSPESELIIARLSADLNVATWQYSEVHRVTHQWVGLQMDSEPPGFERLAQLIIRSVKEPGE